MFNLRCDQEMWNLTKLLVNYNKNIAKMYWLEHNIQKSGFDISIYKYISI